MTTKLKTIIAFVAATIALAAIMPLGSVFKYDYHRGDMWHYGDLVAPFDFPVLKSSAEREADLKRFNETFIPIYECDTTVAARMSASLEENMYLPEVDASRRAEVMRALGEKLVQIYRDGIIAESDNVSSDGLIRVIRDGRISTFSKVNFYTPEEAKAALREVVVGFGISPAGVRFDRYITPDIVYDEELSTLSFEEGRAGLSASKGFVAKGTPIIAKGSIIEGYTADVLDSFKSEYMNSHRHGSFMAAVAGNLLYVSIVMVMSYVFLIYFRNGFSLNFGYVLLLLFIYLMMMILTVTVENIPALSIYLIPYAVVPFFIVTFYDMRMSIFEYVSVLLVCAIATESPFDTFFINLFSGLAGIFVLQNAYHRARIFIATAAVLICYMLTYVAVSFFHEQGFSSIEWGNLLWFFGNVVLLLALYQLIYLFEKIFGFVTNITLLELCDTNQSLLRELSEKAPGTFQHSLQVASLAEEAVSAVGGDPLLARTGALYHDIGKSLNPAYFTENMAAGAENPHDSLEPEESAQIIKQHVTDGYRLAKKNNLPGKIIDFIMTHHGDSIIYFFYHKYKELHGDVYDESLFRYPGPRPISKETGICMMADAVEAASRSLRSYDEQSVAELIDKIVSTQMSEDQFSRSMLSIQDINTVKEVFRNKLTNMYHKRIAYPERETVANS
ncbi:MAG: HDIG domain-containing protein [Rikenellaceae bacterium]|nr:HDIG domain-containing protein [Rikenellaceae bacterium]